MTETPRPRRTPKPPALPGDHPFWLAGPTGYHSWKPIELLSAFRDVKPADIAEFADTWLFSELLQELGYKPDDTLNPERAVLPGFSIEVYIDIQSRGEGEPRPRYPYAVLLVLGEYERHIVFCSTLPALLSTLGGFGPLLVPPAEEDMDEDHELLSEMLGPWPLNLIGRIEAGELNDELVEGEEISGLAVRLAHRAIDHGTMELAERLCDHIATLLPLDARVGRFEIAHIRGQVAEHMHDWAQADQHYEEAYRFATQGGIPTEGDEAPQISSLLARVRCKTILQQLDQADALLREAGILLDGHDHDGHRCVHRVQWCFTAGDLYAAHWQRDRRLGDYEQATASYEQGVEVAQSMRHDSLEQRGRERLLKLLRTARGRRSP